jgi:hypothetical protein
VRVVILRVPGIYAADRLPIERIQAGTPALVPLEDAYTNHIHADDLARIVLAALARGRPGRTYNAADGSWLKMGDYFDLVARSFDLPLPPRVSRNEAESLVSQMLMSFMRESRRLSNRRMRQELRVRLRYPSVAAGLAEAVRLLVSARGGDFDLIVGAAALTVKLPADVAFPCGVTIEILPVTAALGTVAVTFVAFTTANVVAATPPIETDVAPFKFVPATDIEVPTAPLVGLKPVMVGVFAGCGRVVVVPAPPPHPANSMVSASTLPQ